MEAYIPNSRLEYHDADEDELGHELHKLDNHKLLISLHAIAGCTGVTSKIVMKSLKHKLG
jgi:hypothetical protein